jgi:parallel beta helix pectate lyase-like protein
MKTSKSLLVSLFITLAATLPVAAVPRVFVSGLGNDANPGSITSPKRSFTSALTVTDPAGEIIVLDSAGYGPVTINQAVSIIAPPGVYAGITVTAGDGITVTAGAVDAVILRGLTINGGGGGTNGINFTAGGDLHVDNCVINGNSTGLGFGINSSSTGRLSVADTVSRGCNTGIHVSSGRLSATRCRLERNGNGIILESRAKGSISQCVVSGNNVPGISVGNFTVGEGGELNVDDCLIANNGSAGVQASTGGLIRISNSTVTDNATGLANPSGTLLSRTNNTVQGNGANKSGAIGSYTAD